MSGSVDAAKSAIADSPPDLILLDLVMPGRSGLDLLAELSEQASPPPIMVLTATKTVATAVEAMKHGAADYVTKPFEIGALRIKVQQLLEHRALEAEVVRLRPEQPDALHQMALLFDEQGDLDRAAAHYGDALRLAPADAGGFIRLNALRLRIAASLGR